MLERVYPDLGERLTGAVGLLGGGGDGPAHGSPALIAALADDAAARAGGLDPARAAPARGALAAAGAGARGRWPWSPRRRWSGPTRSGGWRGGS